MSNKHLLGFYDYTVILTYAGTLSAFHGILSLLNNSPRQALICLMISGICDMFDGTIAATKDRNRQEKRFGIQIDSLNDIVAFGVLPALFVYTFCPKNPLSLLAASAYLLCALIRLAYFNVLEEDRQDHTDQKRTEYLGLPVTVSALILPAAYAVQSLTPASHLCAFILASMALLFIFPIRIPKPRLKGIIGLAAAGTALLLGMVLEV
ncbi:MAG: CDP-alcohol phosphatidyltransferase family protein [Lachnospiraceae bacterium]|nr:CDP-alcohol phosphatidyltransferase family protein [Lachnospiraceae bacterium]